MTTHKLACDNCDWTGDEPGRDLWDIHHLCERLDVGGIVPAGECPECGCFVYEQSPEQLERDNAVHVRSQLSALVDLVARLNQAFYVEGTAKALRPVMAETKAALKNAREVLAGVSVESRAIAARAERGQR